MGVGLGKIAAAGVYGELSVRPFNAASLDERPAFALFAEPVVLDGHHHQGREVLVKLRHVHVFWPNSGHSPEGVRESVVVGVDHAAVHRAGAVAKAAALGGGHEVSWRLFHVPGPLGRCQNHSGGAVSLLAAVEQMERLGDPAGGVVRLHRQRPAVHDGAGVCLCVLVGCQRYCAKLVLGRSIIVHVALGLHRSQRLPGGHASEGRLVGGEVHHSGLAGRKGLPETSELTLGQSSVGDYVLGVPCDEGSRCVAYGSRTAAAAAAPEHGVEAHLGRPQSGGYADWVVAVVRVRGEAVYLSRIESGVLCGGHDGLKTQVELAVGALAPLVIVAFADANDGNLAVDGVLSHIA